MSRPAEASLPPVVAIVGSAGAVGAMETVLGNLPHDLPAAVLLVLHVAPQHRSLLPQILARATDLRVRPAADGDRLATGTVLVAPPGSHLLLDGTGTLRLDRSELVHHVRPSADVLLLSLAREHSGTRVAVVLSGTGIDGAAGAAALRLAGGTVLAQDEATSQYFGMPGAAILAGAVDRILPLHAIAPAVIECTAMRV